MDETEGMIEHSMSAICSATTFWSNGQPSPRTTSMHTDRYSQNCDVFQFLCSLHGAAAAYGQPPVLYSVPASGH